MCNNAYSLWDIACNVVMIFNFTRIMTISERLSLGLHDYFATTIEYIKIAATPHEKVHLSAGGSCYSRIHLWMSCNENIS